MLGAVALADKPESRGASREFVVEGSGGGYEVLVSPTFVTVFYLPEKVTRAFGSNQKDFRIDMLRDTVVVRPIVNQPGLTANLGINTKKMKINVVLKIAENADEALSQVIFTRATEKAEIERKVEEVVAPIQEEFEAKERALEETVRKRAQDEIAEGMLREFQLAHINAITRNDDNVILRVPRAMRMGEDRYLYFTIQNRGSAPFVLASASLSQDGKDVTAARVRFMPRADGGLGKVDAGQQGAGVIVVPAGQIQVGRPIELTLANRTNKSALRVGGLRVP
jgi:hypothetical protein